MVSVETPLGRIGLGEKALLTLAPGKLVREAEAPGGGLVAPLNVVTAPAGIVFVSWPFTVVVTLRVRTQLAPALPLTSSLPPLNENELAPDVPVRVGVAPRMPWQVPTLRLAGVAMIMLVGMVSVKAMPVSWVLLGLNNVILRVDEEPPYTFTGLKPLLIMMVSG